jgi:hypothetical protein
MRLGRAALQHVRETLYSKQADSFKSFNKLSVAKDREREGARIENALAAYRAIGVPDWNDTRAYSESVWKSRGHNCVSLAHACEDWIAGEDPSVTVAKLSFSRYHVATLIGNLPPGMIRKDMREWPAHVVVCDPWLNVVCPANEYRDRFTQKMAKWENDRKLVAVKGRWLSPQSPEWMRTINRRKDVFIRHRGLAGRVVYVPVQRTGIHNLPLINKFFHR